MSKRPDGKQLSKVSASYIIYHFSTSGISVAAATGVTHPLGILSFSILVYCKLNVLHIVLSWSV